ncbi:proton-conducting transporter membrane subunit [Acidithiobacillus sp. IBUN Pt1247-S3]|uniref:proton-conducting transporter transmembrane domain-containing protein n=1 Tax=Acidithiobacillus sp. IBUN Pt1247-S3 TaxID=3166642 RepID=UPI0034E5955E
MSAHWLPLLILLVPLAGALLAVANRRSAPYLSLLAALITLILAISAAWWVERHGILRGSAGFFSLDALGALYLLPVSFVYFTSSLYAIGYLWARRQEQGPDAAPPRYREYFPLMNVFALVILAVPLVSNLALMWISIELTTVFSAFLVAYEDRAEALEAAWKYVALTSMGAMIALLGVLILYYATHSLGQPATWNGLLRAAPQIPGPILLLAFVLWLVGFGAKTGLVPMHTWLPDAHSQAPASVCAVLSGVETSAALYMLLRLYPVLASNPGIHDPAAWYMTAGLITVGSAAFMLLQVHDFKRMFAYSTIEHMGIILTACGIGAAVHEVGTVYQLFAHGFTKSLCFFAAGLAGVVFGTQEIAQVRGLISRAPAVGWALIIGTLAIAGAPPFALFLSEFEILYTGYASGQYLATGLLTAFIVLAFIALAYQASRIAFGAPATDAPQARLPIPRSSMAAIALAIIPVFVFGFFLPPALGHLVHQAAALLEVHR